MGGGTPELPMKPGGRKVGREGGLTTGIWKKAVGGWGKE